MSDESRRDDETDKTGRKATEAQRQAGINNLKAFNAKRAGLKGSNYKHGVQSFIASGAAPSDIEKRLDELEEGLLRDLGRTPTSAELCLLQAIRTSLGVCLLCDRFLHSGGLANFRKNRWVLSVAAAYNNSLRLNLRELDVDWSGKQAATLSEELAEKRKRSSLSAVLQATEEPTVLPTWVEKQQAPSADSEGLIEGLPKQEAK